MSVAILRSVQTSRTLLRFFSEPASIATGTKTFEPTKSAFTSIPVVDLRAPKADICHHLSSACRKVGFFYIKNHGVPQSLIDDLLKQSKSFFALQEQAKQKLSNKQEVTGGVRGYFRLNDEQLNLEEKLSNYVGDLKEGFDIGRHIDENNFSLPERKSVIYGQNVWPTHDNEFKKIMELYYQELHYLGENLMRDVALSLCLEENFFDSKVDRAMSTLRLLHYPPQDPNSVGSQLGCGSHSDYGLCTILAQFSAGLQVRNARGHWIEAPPIPGSFVVNLGDMMNRWTNERYASTIHRVINTSKVHRYSIPYFFNPNYDAMVECLESCSNATAIPKFPPQTSGEILLNRYESTFSHFPTPSTLPSR